MSRGITSLQRWGENFVIVKKENNGYGGYAAREWTTFEWDESILDLLDMSPEQLNYIRKKTYENRLRRRQERDASYQEEKETSSIDDAPNYKRNIGVGVLLGVGAYKLINHLRKRRKGNE